MSRAPVIVVAVGNALRGDDAAGLEVAGLLVGRLPEHVELVRSRGEATALLELWQDRRLAVVVDAVAGGGAPGDVMEIDALEDGLPAGVSGASTHDFGPAEALELGHLMETLPERLLIVGVVGEKFTIGDPPSDAVRRALDGAADRVLRLVERA